MSNLRKINKILGITLIVFSLGVFANYSKTSSKYFVDDTDLKTDNIVNLLNRLFSNKNTIMIPLINSPDTKEQILAIPRYPCNVEPYPNVYVDAISKYSK